MECRDKAAAAPRKLVQARLPFKRLNPVPKDKYNPDSEVKKVKSSPSSFSPSQDPSLDASCVSLDNVENDCQLDPEVNFVPELVNGKGPLDHFIRKPPPAETAAAAEPGQGHRLSARGDPRGAAPTAPGAGTEQLGRLHPAPGAQGGDPPETEAPCGAVAGEGEGSGAGNRSLSAGIRSDATETPAAADAGTPAAADTGTPAAADTGTPAAAETPPAADTGTPPAAAETPPAAAETPAAADTGTPAVAETPPAAAETPAAADAGTPAAAGARRRDVIFEGKMPVVLLEDIMMAKSPQVSSLDGSVSSGNETVESSPEGDSGLTNSPLSARSLSSPEAQPPVERKSSSSPLAASTPLRKVPQKFHKSSAEKEKLRSQRDQERADKLQKLQAEREEKGRLKEEAKAAKERAKEEAKKKKEEEKELKEKERREKKEKEEKEKAEKLRVKEEKRKERQEALEAKLEEKRKKEEEKRLREEEKRINAQKAEITRFFQKPKTPQAPKILAGSCGKFAPFEIKENMVLAPLCRTALDPDFLEQLDRLLHVQNSDASFLRELKCRKPRKTGPTFVHSGPDIVNSDVVVVDNCKPDAVPERGKFGRMKLLQFCENHRPAYWGTWNKQTTAICARNPWAKDTKLLDYEVDSDEEWEEEEPGESLSHSEGDDEEDGEDEDDDDGFFVPHGYLSEDEGVTEECDPENHKVRQKLKAKEWDELMAKGKRFHVLQPVKVGCVWEGTENTSSTNTDLKVLQQFTACVLDPPVAEEEQQIQKCDKKRAKDQQILGQLLPLLHGNVNGSKVIIQEFQECCRQGLLGEAAERGGAERPPAPPGDETPVPSKARLKRIISENSVYEKRPEYRMCWYVHSEVLRSFRREHLPVPCRWNYVTQVPSAGKEEGVSVPGAPGVPVPLGTPLPGKRKATGTMSITKFMKRPRDAEQAEAAELDGFQADTEEDEEDDDCMIVDVQPGKDPTLAVTSPAAGSTHQDPPRISPSSTI